MQKCTSCNEGRIVDILKHKDGELHLCPNCMLMMCLNGEFNYENDTTLQDDITGEYGAMRFESYGESYNLEKETMFRLIVNHLEPEEHQALVAKYGYDKFSLHSDFYDEDGTALQPHDVDLDEYYEEMGWDEDEED